MSDWILRVGAADARLLQALAARRHPWLIWFFRALTHLGDAPVPTGLALLLLAGAIPGLEAVGAAAFLTLALAFGISQGLKRTISRPRPTLPVGLASLVHPPDRFSFPSGHATASLAVALPVAVALAGGPGGGGGGAGTLLALLVLSPALLVGVSRCYLGVHYPGDVLAGWVIGSGAFLVVRTLLSG
ncbi:MAG: phosphatase PAP2 family protein [Gemmatimonadales bacterium]|nr:MAG: phosphatase PAP2 family protein [Gemmatimonadales bacterium]